MEEFINKRIRNSSGRNSKTRKWDIVALSFIIVIIGFFMLYRPGPKTDVGTEVIKLIARSSLCQKVRQTKNLAQSLI